MSQFNKHKLLSHCDLNYLINLWESRQGLEAVIYHLNLNVTDNFQTVIEINKQRCKYLFKYL